MSSIIAGPFPLRFDFHSIMFRVALQCKSLRAASADVMVAMALMVMLVSGCDKKTGGEAPAASSSSAPAPQANAEDATRSPAERKQLEEFEKDDPAAVAEPSRKSLRLSKNADGNVTQSGAVSFGGGGQDYSDTHIANDTGGGVGLISIVGDAQQEVGTLFITGKEAMFDANGRLVKGSGYMQAAPGQHCSIVFTGEKATGGMTQMQLGVSRIDWDDDGKTTKIYGVEPVIRQLLAPDVKVKSDLAAPDVKNGILILAGDGGIEFRFKIKFGYGVKFLRTSHP